ncbi:PLD nuclease N-terminal domain-containing protein [Lentzea alba]|uniref:PLD nuclease N-terminal domain-containing protein n=1 Tax=Lentzea alba TaxID=2714351 RepID=UPI0039BFB7F7
MTRKHWSELTPWQRRTAVATMVAEVALAGAAWTDLALRPAEFVRGRKLWWALVILVNFVGPIAYFRWGRRT